MAGDTRLEVTEMATPNERPTSEPTVTVELTARELEYALSGLIVGSCVLADVTEFREDDAQDIIEAAGHKLLDSSLSLPDNDGLSVLMVARESVDLATDFLSVHNALVEQFAADRGIDLGVVDDDGPMFMRYEDDTSVTVAASLNADDVPPHIRDLLAEYAADAVHGEVELDGDDMPPELIDWLTDTFDVDLE